MKKHVCKYSNYDRFSFSTKIYKMHLMYLNTINILLKTKYQQPQCHSCASNCSELLPDAKCRGLGGSWSGYREMKYRVSSRLNCAQSTNNTADTTSTKCCNPEGKSTIK